MKGKIIINQDVCKGCEVCIAFCPKNLITLADKLNANGYIPASFKDNGECTACTSCALVCPEVAIEVYRG
jgi:2-oxoglutarate ferredoxin oxidoreductase subunit delta